MNSVTTPPQKVIGPFEILQTIGRGASSTVYKARHIPTGKYAAIKVGPNFLELEPDALERFKREFTVIRELRHPNLVHPLALGEHNQVPYLVLEYVSGQNLEDFLKQHGSLPVEDAVAIFLQAADGLRFLHEHQILHRDIKPSNIFLNRDHQAKLGDFGLLKRMSDDAQLTRSHQGMGTVEYGAPEQFEDAKRADQRCDLYSLAATLYTALTGKFPFGVGGHLHILQRKLLSQFVPLRLLIPEIDPALDQLVNRCLHPDPEQRPNHCDEFLTVLRNYRAQPAAASADEITKGAVKPPNGPERRASLRFAAELTASFVPFHQKMRGRWEATIVDISPAGVRLQTPRPVAVNSVLQVTLGKGARTQLALVRWVRPGKGQMQLVGCSFVHPLPQNEFDALQQQSGARRPSAN